VEVATLVERIVGDEFTDGSTEFRFAHQRTRPLFTRVNNRSTRHDSQQTDGTRRQGEASNAVGTDDLDVEVAAFVGRSGGDEFTDGSTNSVSLTNRQVRCLPG
jgi:hypothetical protein